MSEKTAITTTTTERAFLVGVAINDQPQLLSLDDSLTELALLADTAGMVVVGTLTQRLNAPNQATFIGKGKLTELKNLAEETEAIAVIGALLFVVIRMLILARQAPDAFGAYLCYGFAAVLFFQMFANVGMNLNLMPVTGLPFPFLSYGGSSIFTFFIGIGLVQSVALRRNTAYEK